jgi:hypothetical protein
MVSVLVQGLLPDSGMEFVVMIMLIIKFESLHTLKEKFLKKGFQFFLFRGIMHRK